MTYYNSNVNRDLVRIHSDSAARLRAIHDDFLVTRGRELLAAEGKDEANATQDDLASVYAKAQAEFDRTAQAVERR